MYKTTWENIEDKNTSSYKRFGGIINMRKCIAFLLSLLLFLCGCSNKLKDEEIAKLLGTDKLPYGYYHASFVIDTSDLVEVTTYVDYVFVAKVTGYEKTEYDDESIRTYYKVVVEENIKGELIKDQEIILVKSGGITEDNESFSLCFDDILPQIGEKYIFCAYVMEYIDELYCFGPNTVCKVEQTDLMEDASYLQYIEATKKTAEDIFEGKHIVSRYDVNYNE